MDCHKKIEKNGYSIKFWYKDHPTVSTGADSVVLTNDDVDSTVIFVR
jgi:hypothetical protein